MSFLDFIFNRSGAEMTDEPEPPRKSWEEQRMEWMARSSAKIAAMETVEEVAEYVSQNYAFKGAAHGCAAVSDVHQAVVKAGLIRIAEIIRKELREPPP